MGLEVVGLTSFVGYLSRSLLGLFPTNLCAGYAASPSLLLFGRYFFTAPAVCARPSLFTRAWLARAAQFREWGEGIQFIGYQHLTILFASSRPSVQGYDRVDK